MADPRVPLKNPALAAILAYFLPGAGHLYQGRIFKAVLYAVCIWGMFLYGMQKSGWSALHTHQISGGDGHGLHWQRNWGFLTHLGIGTPATFAFLQTKRFQSESNQTSRQLDGELVSDFKGIAYDIVPSEGLAVAGRIRLNTRQTEYGPEVSGVFSGDGLFPDGEVKPVELELQGGFLIGPPYAGDDARGLEIDILKSDSGPSSGSLNGVVPRSLFNRVGMPATEQQIERLHGLRGKGYELALVYTWIAGLLNILAVWDAFAGPAYGYGDEKPDAEDDSAKQPEDLSASEPNTAPTA
ncbi:DUF6677 family protein [Thalassoroseus pseudoceratinae]|uniref:DUF6677 family protein n=1 Tax=Thalassoroseus pseudoceratinae TaxID=2713176 RepID=UPI00141D9216|nr:DUF6677 family protein [Thalassoroseus pseudoceratinae]